MYIKLENRQVAVFTAVILAVIMLFLPGSSRSRYSFRPEELAAAINAGEDQITAADLSEWLIQGKSDLLLVDTRSETDYAKGSIKGSVNIPLAKLLERSTIDTELPETKTIVIYSNGDSHAHQAWLVLRTAGVNSYVLQGGYNGWVSAILNPAKPADSSDDEILKYEAAMSLAASFGGTGAVKTQDNLSKKENQGGAPVLKPAIQPKKKKLSGCG